MHPVGAAAIVFLFVAMDAMLVGTLIKWARDAMRELARGHPPVEPAPEAVRRSFQTFRVGIVNLGLSVHVAADASHLHLYPSRMARWVGMVPMSIPWEEIRVKASSGLTGTWAMIGKQHVQGPRWCMALARPEGERALRRGG